MSRAAAILEKTNKGKKKKKSTTADIVWDIYGAAGGNPVAMVSLAKRVLLAVIDQAEKRDIRKEVKKGKLSKASGDLGNTLRKKEMN